MANSSCYLNFAHLNPGSLVSNFSEFCAIIKDVPLHIIAISETWLKAKHKDSSFSLSGYNLLRKDRIDNENRRAGGVALYIRKTVDFKLIKKNQLDSTFDFLFIEVSNASGDKLLIGVIYNPPKVKFIRSICRFLTDCAGKYKNIIILGDFNLNVNSASSYVRKFKDLLESINFNIASYYDTNFLEESSSCLDLLLINNPQYLVFFTQISVPGLFTTHDMIYGSYHFSIATHSPDLIFYRRALDRIDLVKLMSDAISLPWYELASFVGVNDKLIWFNSLVLSLLNKHAPLRKIKWNSTEERFQFSPTLLKHRNIRDYLHQVWKCNKNPSTWNNFRSYRNKVNGMIKNEKFLYFKTKVFNLDLPNDVLWKNFKNYGLSKSKDRCKLEFTPKEFSDHFAVLPDSVVYNPLPVSGATVCDSSKFHFHNISRVDVLLALQDIQSNSIGPDGIPISFIRMLCPVIIETLTDIINSALTKSVFPNAWKTAYVTPIGKKTKPVTLNDFRPISVMSSLSKLLEKIMKQQIIAHISSCNLLNLFQSGFREKHSTTAVLIKVVDDISKATSQGKISLLVLLDFAKAFDSVNHDALLYKLQHQFHFADSAVKFLRSYLSERCQIVKVENKFSSPVNTVCGVPQGSILGPILFSMFINDIVDSCSIKYHLFADDLQIYDSASFNDADLCVRNVNFALDQILAWSRQNHIKINPCKSKAMFITSNKSRLAYLNTFDVVIDGHKIDFVDKSRNLGIIFDNLLSWDDHINFVCSKIYATLSNLSIHAGYIPRAAKLKLVQALIVPHLVYGAPVYSGCSMKSFRKLNLAFNSCARFVYNKRKYDSISEYSRKILGCDLNNYYEYNTVLFLFKIILYKCPQYLFDMIQFVRSPRTFGINLPPNCKSKQRQSSFFVRAVKLWNTLDPAIQTLTSLKGFKSLCFSHFSSD